MFTSRRSRLVQKNVDRLLPILLDVAANWPVFMGQLGFPQKRIKLIQRDTPLGDGHSVACLRTALFQWAVSEFATYDVIISALRGPMFNNEVLARKVESHITSDITIQDQFDENMTAEELFEYLRQNGVCGQDCDLLKGKKINGAAFSKMKPCHIKELGISSASCIIIEDLLKGLNANKFMHVAAYPSLWDSQSASKYQSDTNQLVDYLRCLYSNLIPTRTSSHQWPPSPTPRVFEITMVKNKPDPRRPHFTRLVRLSMKGKLNNIHQGRSLIKLQNMFKELKGKRKIILLEGAPESGKSTLSRYISQQWSKKLLFQEYELVILVQLRDLKCHSDIDFVDLLPAQHSQAVKRLIHSGGQGVLFILDGWDELSSQLRRQQNSIFHTLIQQASLYTNPFYKSDVIVTSRPIACCDLFDNIISLHVELIGFSQEALENYFMECLEGDRNALEILKQEIKENPELADSCHLPLDASIMAYIFKNSNYSLPKRQQNYIAEFIRHCMFRHIQERGPSDLNIVLLPPLDKLPDEINQPFLRICKLAFDGVLQDEVIFTETDVKADFNTLGLLQGVEKADCGWKISYNFLHLSIQEFMAAFYITTLSEDKQLTVLRNLFSSESSRFVAVLKFYAAITKLKSSSINALLVEIATECGVERPKKRDKILLCSLVCCLYEAQDVYLCELIAHHLQYGLDLSCITLGSKDCLSIGYFLYCICKTTSNEFKVDLGWCSIDDRGCYYLASHFRKCNEVQIGSRMNAVLNIKLRNNGIHPEGVKHLSKLFSYTTKLNLIMNQHISDLGTDYIVNELQSNTTIKTLNMQDCGLTSKGAKYLAHALTTNSSIENLYIGVNNLGDVGVHDIALALEHNHSLKRLRLVTCSLTDVGLRDLAISLQRNKSLTELYIRSYLSEYRNIITEKGINYLKTYLENNTTLTMLVLPRDNEMFIDAIEETVNKPRKQRGLPVIKVKAIGWTSDEIEKLLSRDFTQRRHSFSLLAIDERRMTQLVPSFHDHPFHSWDDCCTTYPFNIQEMNQTTSTGEDPRQVWLSRMKLWRTKLNLRSKSRSSCICESKTNSEEMYVDVPETEGATPMQELQDTTMVISSSVKCEDSPDLRSPATKRPKLKDYCNYIEGDYFIR